MADVRITGGCQCGAVRYALHEQPANPHICHCRMCQKAFGSFFAPLTGVHGSKFELTRGALATFMSSDKAERGFCRDCGTPLTFRYLHSERIAVSIGSLDDPAAIAPLNQYGIEARLPYFASLVGLPGDKTTEDDAPELAAAIRNTSHQHPDHDTASWPSAGDASDGDKPLGSGDLAAISVRVANATPGPWKSWIEGRDHLSGDTFVQTPDEDIYLTNATHADHDFIAAARQDIPKLLAEISRLSKLLIEK